jgi:hypothetical protein
VRSVSDDKQKKMIIYLLSEPLSRKSWKVTSVTDDMFKKSSSSIYRRR